MTLGPFAERVRAAFDERYVMVPIEVHASDDPFDGESVAWARHNPSGYAADVYHTDRDCPHFPGGTVVARPVSLAEERVGQWNTPDPCSYCAPDVGGDD